jgi:hypothetical protein
MRTTSLLAAAAASLSLLLPVLVAAPAAQAAPPRAASAPVTAVTLVVPSCEGCEVSVHGYFQGSMDFWDSTTKAVKDGTVTFKVPTARTPGLSVMVRAPWEGATGYVTNVVFRYRGMQPGTKVGFAQARRLTRASGCWAGTASADVTLRVKVRRVRVPGEGGPVAGSIAWTAVTQDWLRPLVRTWHGIIGTQDVMPCNAP